jgi:flagellar basal body-associated protein FliL
MKSVLIILILFLTSCTIEGGSVIMIDKNENSNNYNRQHKKLMQQNKNVSRFDEKKYKESLREKIEEQVEEELYDEHHFFQGDKKGPD